MLARNLIPIFYLQLKDKENEEISVIIPQQEPFLSLLLYMWFCK